MPASIDRATALVITLFLAMCPRGGLAQVSCTAGEWSAPRIVRRTFNDSATVHPNDVAFSATQMVVTSEFPPVGATDRNLGDAVTPIAIRVDLLSGRVTEIRKPDPRMSYTGLRVIIDRQDVAHLFWGEVAGKTVVDTTGGRGATQVWSVRLTGDSIGQAHLVYSSKEIRWEDTLGPNILVDASGRLHLTVHGRLMMTRHPFVHLTLDVSGWRHERVDAGRLVFPESIVAAESNDTLHVLFLSPDVGQGPSPFGSVFYTRRALHDTLWTPALLVQAATPAPARSPLISIAPSGQIRAFWMQAARAGQLFTSRMMREAVIANDPPSVVARSEYVGDEALRTVRGSWTDACGVTHIHVIAGAIGDRSQAQTITWNGSSWSISRPLPYQYLFPGRSTVRSTTPDAVRRVWSTAFVAPGLPIMLFWWESSQRVVMPDR